MDFVQFYLGKGSDHLGRRLQALWRMSDEDIETGHDFIQVLFPLLERSQAVPGSPVLDQAALEEFRNNPDIQANLLRSLLRMLDFYGFRLDQARKEVTPAEDFHHKSADWLFPDDHNHLRITRILKCLKASGMDEYASAFFKALSEVADPKRVTRETLSYWQAAVE